MKPLLEYAGIDINNRIDDAKNSVHENARIRQALDKVWDGEQSTAEILAKLIESVGPAIVQAGRMRG